MKILMSSIVDLRKTAHNRLHQFVNHLLKRHEITVLRLQHEGTVQAVIEPLIDMLEAKALYLRQG